MKKEFKMLLMSLTVILTLFVLVYCATENEPGQLSDNSNNGGGDKVTSTIPLTTPVVTTAPNTTTAQANTTLAVTTVLGDITTTVAINNSTTTLETTTTPITTPDTTPIYVSVHEDFDYYSNLDGDKIVEIYKDNGCPDELLPSGVKGKVSEGELEKIRKFFSDLNTLRFIPVAYENYDYFDASKACLHMILEANSAPSLSNVSEAERKLLPDSFIGDAMKLTTAQIKELYKKYLGIDFDPNTMSDGTFYLEAYDSYYSWTSGAVGPDQYFERFCAWELENGNIIVLLEDESGNACFATVKSTSDSYVILQAFDSSYESYVVPTYSYDREWIKGKNYDEISEKYGECLKTETSEGNSVLYYPVYENSKLQVVLMVFMNEGGKAYSTMVSTNLK